MAALFAWCDEEIRRERERVLKNVESGSAMVCMCRNTVAPLNTLPRSTATNSSAEQKQHLSQHNPVAIRRPINPTALQNVWSI